MWHWIGVSSWTSLARFNQTKHSQMILDNDSNMIHMSFSLRQWNFHLRHISLALALRSLNSSFSACVRGFYDQENLSSVLCSHTSSIADMLRLSLKAHVLVRWVIKSIKNICQVFASLLLSYRRDSLHFTLCNVIRLFWNKMVLLNLPITLLAWGTYEFIYFSLLFIADNWCMYADIFLERWWNDSLLILSISKRKR